MDIYFNLNQKIIFNQCPEFLLKAENLSLRTGKSQPTLPVDIQGFLSRQFLSQAIACCVE